VTVSFEQLPNATRAIVYHYVRRSDKHLPYFRYLSVENFEKQIRWLSNALTLPTRETFVNACRSGEKWIGTILTFDDGLMDHYRYVLPVLKKYGLWGIFFPSTGPLTNDTLLDVHKVHLILGKLGPEKALEELNSIIESEEIQVTVEKRWAENTYRLQESSDSASIEFKRILNYGIFGSHRKKVIDMLILGSIGSNEDSIASRYYMDKSHLIEMLSEGMLIGSHTINHPILSTLDEREQLNEIDVSTSYLESLTSEDISIFAYPYGGKSSFDLVTERILKKSGFSVSFTCEPRNISDHDFNYNQYALPRYDCNQFPFGNSTMG
jgi:peptidoglycan/xylan/chitin deacetylase (PgdA/CDA1 family)